MKIRASKHLLVLLALCLVTALGALPLNKALAQSNFALESVRVDIWPEYDQPSALVIYNVTLAPDSSLPAPMTLRIPASAGKPYAVAWEAPDQGLYDINYTMTAAGDWIEISFSTPALDLRLEYYDPDIQINDGKRDFVFHWPGDYTVNNLSLMVQQPMTATNMVLIPDAGTGRQATDGMTYYTLVAGQVNAGTTFDLQISYDKADDTLTNPQQFQAAQPVQPVDSATAGRVTLDQTLPWAIGGIGVLLIAGGLVWYWRVNSAGSKNVEKGSRRHGRSKAEAGGNAAEGSGTAAFCHQCGNKARPGDLFCRICGTKLR